MSTQTQLYDPLVEKELAGFALRPRGNGREAQISSAVALLADAKAGKIQPYILMEAIAPRTPALLRAIDANYPGIIRFGEAHTTSDFPLLTGDIIDRMLLARYREYPAAWRTFCKISTLNDFRSVRRLATDGLEGQWDDVAEQEEITYGDLAETGYSYAPKKYARGAKISFEALLNDDLGAFDDIPSRLGRGGARTVAKFATSLYIDTTGPHASLYTGGNANIVTSNPALSIAGLQTAMTVLNNMVDADGEPITVEGVILVVPPALEVTARNILNATQLLTTVVGGATNQELVTTNWMSANMTLVVDPYIPIVASASNGATTWALFANPGVSRPALEVGFLRGFQEPVLYQKLANTTRVGGGVDQMAGDFDSMSQEYKGVIAFGGTRLDPKATVASNGSGS